jgi:hypothetical protein
LEGGDRTEFSFKNSKEVLLVDGIDFYKKNYVNVVKIVMPMQPLETSPEQPVAEKAGDDSDNED